MECRVLEDVRSRTLIRDIYGFKHTEIAFVGLELWIVTF